MLRSAAAALWQMMHRILRVVQHAENNDAVIRDAVINEAHIWHVYP